MSLYPNRIIYVPACLLCPYFMAESKKEDSSWRESILSYLIENSFSLIPLPCPESSFSHPQTGIQRPSHGVQFYEALDGFQEHCSALSRQIVNQIAELTSHGYTVCAILGIEHSPTCAVNYMYTHQGMMKRAGIFIEKLARDLENSALQIPILGINRRFPQKALKSIESLKK